MLFHVPCLGPRGQSFLLLPPNFCHDGYGCTQSAICGPCPVWLPQLCTWTSIKRASSVHQAPRAPQSRLVPVILIDARCPDRIKLQPTIRHPFDIHSPSSDHTPPHTTRPTRAYTQEADAGREPSATQDTGLTCRLILFANRRVV
ncbi:hypothetical protein J3458_022490 [Metarhizium acridum]|uniref:uncharacterized protein n=1 Tax=Metarhizium acridum TaxID=92637 RepID=UPI001C6A97C5|nr:hypothetical protein J3458_022490 [Metarhizium acridum]